MSVLYHPNKTNVVANALSRLTMGSVSHVEEAKKDLVKDVHRLDGLDVRMEDSSNGGFIVTSGEHPQYATGFVVLSEESDKHLTFFITCHLLKLLKN